MPGRVERKSGSMWSARSEARTNDVDADDERRRLEMGPSTGAASRGSQRGGHHPIEVGGQAGIPAAWHLFAQLRRMVVFGHSPSGLNHLVDLATGWGSCR